MKAIGFANKYYTLWEITERNENISTKSYVSVKYARFIQNISMNEEVARKLYPSAKVDYDLKGCFNRILERKIVFLENETFRFGKYKGKNIKDTLDVKYVQWYWSVLDDGDHKTFVQNVLEKNGYELYEGEMLAKEEIDKMKEVRCQCEQMMESIINSETLEFVADGNPNDKGEYAIGNGFVTYHFPFVKENMYNGYPWYQVVDVNGKTKSIKNKKVIITDWEVEESDLHFCTMKILVKDFKITKI